MTSSPAPGEKGSFEAALAAANLSATRLGAVLAAVAMPAGIGLDQLTHPEKVTQFFWIRVLASLACLAILPLTWAPLLKKSPELLGCAVFLVCQCSVVVMIYRLEGPDSPYYAGLNSTVLAACLLFNWHWRYTALLCVATIVLD